MQLILEGFITKVLLYLKTVPIRSFTPGSLVLFQSQMVLKWLEVNGFPPVGLVVVLEHLTHS